MKRQSFVALTVVALSLLAACYGSERATLTGSYGSAVVTGQVVMSNGGSPLGVEVSVRGTGMAVILAEDGQFAFAGVPEEAVLGFQRARDGIDATMRIQPTAGHVVVELAQTTAKKSGRRRAAGSMTYQFEGIIQSASATEITVDTSRQPGVVITITPQTVIRHGGTVMTAADLVAGMRVHVKALKVGEAFNATSIMVQNNGDEGENDDRPAERQYEGTIVSASATELVIFSSKKEEVTFVIDATTVIRKGNTPILAADLQPGWRVHVKASTADDGTKTARLVIVQQNR